MSAWQRSTGGSIRRAGSVTLMVESITGVPNAWRWTVTVAPATSWVLVEQSGVCETQRLAEQAADGYVNQLHIGTYAAATGDARTIGGRRDG